MLGQAVPNHTLKVAKVASPLDELAGRLGMLEERTRALVSDLTAVAYRIDGNGEDAQVTPVEPEPAGVIPQLIGKAARLDSLLSHAFAATQRLRDATGA